MKRLFLLSLLMPAAPALAQVDAYLSSVRPPVQVSMMGIYERYVDEDVAISQFSVPLSVLIPLGNSVGIGLQTSPAAAGGDALESLGGLSDARLALSYYARMGTSSIVASVTANLPSGRKGLTSAEFATSVLLSQNFYEFRVPTLGQGLNLAPGLTWATPLSDDVVLGLGAAYHFRGGFEPLEDGVQYDPGDEILITGGLDAGLSEAWTVSGDLSFTYYGTDTVGDVERYRSGSKVATTLQLARRSNQNELRLLARYRTRARGEVPLAGDFVTEEERTVPDHVLLHAGYRYTTNATAVTLFAQGRLFSETQVYPSTRVADVGVLPEYALSAQWSLLTRFVYTLGDFSGFEGGIGLSARL